MNINNTSVDDLRNTLRHLRARQGDADVIPLLESSIADEERHPQPRRTVLKMLQRELVWHRKHFAPADPDDVDFTDLLIPDDVKFADLQLTVHPDGHQVTFNWAPIERICQASGLPTDTFRDAPEGLLVMWYRAHLTIGGAHDPVADNIFADALAVISQNENDFLVQRT